MWYQCDINVVTVWFFHEFRFLPKKLANTYLFNVLCLIVVKHPKHCFYCLMADRVCINSGQATQKDVANFDYIQFRWSVYSEN